MLRMVTGPRRWISPRNEILLPKESRLINPAPGTTSALVCTGPDSTMLPLSEVSVSRSLALIAA